MFLRYNYRIYPNKEQSEFLNKTFGCVRHIYNWGLAKKIEAYKKGEKISRFDLNKMITTHKKENEWLKIPPAKALEEANNNLDTAYKNFFRRIKESNAGKKGFPRFKSKKDNRDSFTTYHPTANRVRFAENKIDILKCKNIKAKLHRHYDGKLKSITIIKKPSGKYYASCLIDIGGEIPNKRTITKETTIGIDLGIKDFLISSNDTKFGNARFLERDLKRLRSLQRRHRRKQMIEVEGDDGKKRKYRSNNREKDRIKVAKLHERIQNRRKDFIENLTHKLTSENQVGMICVENLNVKGMVKNKKLARHIADVSWGLFLQKLKEKAERRGITIYEVDRFFASSKTCNHCGWKYEDLKLSERSWRCKNCQNENDRDLNAAYNIRDFGLKKQKK